MNLGLFSKKPDLFPPGGNFFSLDDHEAFSRMNIRTQDGQSFETERDLTAAERHILQKLMIWETMAKSLEQFRDKKREAFLRGWNKSGPVEEGPALKAIIRDMERRVRSRLAA
jgi:hypothetical protein